MSGHRQRKKELHGKTSVKESEAASTAHRQGPRCFLPPRRQKMNHFSNRFLPKQEDNVRSFPQPNMGSLLHLQMCELVSRVAAVGSPCLLQGGPQVSVIAIFTSAFPFLLISVLNLPCYSVSPSFPVVPSVGIVSGLLPASLKDNCCYDVPLYLLFFRLKTPAHPVFP